MDHSKVIYFDNNATTRIAPEVYEAMIPYLTEYYGNPSSIHHFGGQLAAKIEEAKTSALKEAPKPDAKESDDYKALQAEFDSFKRKVETASELKKGGVKEKFIDNVFALLTEDKPAAEQLDAIREKYEEYFSPQEQSQAAASPQFGADTKGQMPSGKTAPSMEDIWGIPKR